MGKFKFTRWDQLYKVTKETTADELKTQFYELIDEYKQSEFPEEHQEIISAFNYALEYIKRNSEEDFKEQDHEVTEESNDSFEEVLEGYRIKEKSFDELVIEDNNLKLEEDTSYVEKEEKTYVEKKENNDPGNLAFIFPIIIFIGIFIYQITSEPNTEVENATLEFQENIQNSIVTINTAAQADETHCDESEENDFHIYNFINYGSQTNAYVKFNVEGNVSNFDVNNLYVDDLALSEVLIGEVSVNGVSILEVEIEYEPTTEMSDLYYRVNEVEKFSCSIF